MILSRKNDLFPLCGAATTRQHLAASLLNSGDATLTTSVAAVYVCVSLSRPYVNERDTDLTSAPVTGSTRKKTDVLSPTLSQFCTASLPRDRFCW